MPIQFRCTHCHKRVQAPDSAAGKKAKCPICERLIAVPMKDSAANRDDVLAGFDEFMTRYFEKSETPNEPQASVSSKPTVKPNAEQHSRNRSTCPTCNASVAPSSRWCRICHSNVVNPKIGRLASPGKRLGAHLLQSLLGAAVYLLSFFILLAVNTKITAINYVLVFAVLLLLFAIFVWEMILYASGRSIGKLILGMRVVKEDGRTAGFVTMLIRELIGKMIISPFVFSLGYIWILIDQDHQAWHDKLVQTYVVE